MPIKAKKSRPIRQLPHLDGAQLFELNHLLMNAHVATECVYKAVGHPHVKPLAFAHMSMTACYCLEVISDFFERHGLDNDLIDDMAKSHFKRFLVVMRVLSGAPTPADHPIPQLTPSQVMQTLQLHLEELTQVRELCEAELGNLT